MVYGLLAMGLVLIYRSNRVLNFAQGQLGVVAAVFLVKCFYDFGFNYWFALALALGPGRRHRLALRAACSAGSPTARGCWSWWPPSASARCCSSSPPCRSSDRRTSTGPSPSRST